MQITNADRRALLDSPSKFSEGRVGYDADLITATYAWMKQLLLKLGFEHNLQRDIVYLVNTLRKTDQTSTVADLARGGLAFLRHSNRIDQSPLGPLGLLDDGFAGYAAHLIREFFWSSQSGTALVSSSGKRVRKLSSRMSMRRVLTLDEPPPSPVWAASGTACPS